MVGHGFSRDIKLSSQSCHLDRSVSTGAFALFANAQWRDLQTCILAVAVAFAVAFLSLIPPGICLSTPKPPQPQQTKPHPYGIITPANQLQFNQPQISNPPTLEGARLKPCHK
jgi:hypothetical protein